MKDIKVYIDASSDILYASYYIKGLEDLFGKKTIKYSNKYFEHFKHDNRFFACVIKQKSIIKKIVVDFTDDKEIDTQALDWADVYGKINLTDEKKLLSDKLIAIGPSFGINIYSKYETIILGLLNFLKASHRIPNKRRFFSDYRAQLLRPKLNDYSGAKSEPNYIYFLSSLWKKEKATNNHRANFILACKNCSSYVFEGGFAPRTRNDMIEYKALTVSDRVSMSYYMKHMKQSSIAFNTPAVKDCHGWKLAEFLCMGKAIISTPLSRILPKEIIDLEDVLYTDGTLENITEKLDLLNSNIELKNKLELNAKQYFEDELHPKVVIFRLLNSY